jgi:DNA mismatch repair protein MutS
MTAQAVYRVAAQTDPVAAAASCCSILFDGPCPDLNVVDQVEMPEIFGDLKLDQIVHAITAGREEYNLKPFFYWPLRHVRTVYYRHEVMRDLENERILKHVESFAEEMRMMRDHLARAEKLYYQRQKQRWFLDAVKIYAEAVQGLLRHLSMTEVRSQGLIAFREHLIAYTTSGAFRTLIAETEKLRHDLAEVRYSLQIRGRRITVAPYNPLPDYSADVVETFQKFQQGAPRDYGFQFPSDPNMNHVEAGVLDLVAQLYPEIFDFLEKYCEKNAAFLDPTIARFDREVQFYLAYLQRIRRLERAGLSFCFPEVDEQSKEVAGKEVYDLALAEKLALENAVPVTNEFYLRDAERIFVVSGPNQGGKTTFARTFGQLHWLASLGLPVPGSAAKLFLFDQLFTHFEKGEDVQSLRGKLEDELVRIHHILEQATPNSILILNESFLSTTLNDALFLSKQVMERVIELDMLCVSVTFLDEMASLGPSTVSMVSTVDPKDPARRTFRVVRRPADGRAYATVIAEKYGLTQDAIRKRILRRTQGEHKK